MSQQFQQPSHCSIRCISGNRATFFDLTRMPNGNCITGEPRIYNIRLAPIPSAEITESALQELYFTPVHPSAIWSAPVDRSHEPIARRTTSNKHVRFADAITTIIPQTTASSQTLNTDNQGQSRQIIGMENQQSSEKSETSTVKTRDRSQQVTEQKDIEMYPLILDGGCSIPISEHHLAHAASNSLVVKKTTQKIIKHTISTLGNVKRVMGQAWSSIRTKYQSTKRDFEKCTKGPIQSSRFDDGEPQELRESSVEQHETMLAFSETGRSMDL